MSKCNLEYFRNKFKEMRKKRLANKYNANHFIRKFNRICGDKFCVGKEDVLKKQKCALGHCEDMELFFLIKILGSFNTPIINDGKDPRYQQTTPKARILAALRDVKENLN